MKVDMSQILDYGVRIAGEKRFWFPMEIITKLEMVEVTVAPPVVGAKRWKKEKREYSI